MLKLEQKDVIEENCVDGKIQRFTKAFTVLWISISLRIN